MNPLVRKEIRLILPFWGIAMFLAVVPCIIVPRQYYVPEVDQIIYWALGFGGVLLGLAPFGQEFGLGTFSSFLAQPFERRRIWKTKVLLMAVAVLLVLAVFMLSIYGRLHHGVLLIHDTNLRVKDIEQLQRKWFIQQCWGALGTGSLLMLVAITGGFWASLLFRQIGAALWFVILVPGAISFSFQLLAHGLSGIFDILVFPALVIYSVVGFLWARRMLFHAQDSQWLGETISLLSLSPASTRKDTALSRRKRPLRALVRKEFQSHQITLIIAFGLVMFHGGSLVVRRFCNFPSNSELRFAIEAVPFLWLLLPWLIGSVAVAEDRKLGVMESQLCLPATRRLQFSVKFVIVLLLGIVLGGLMPCLIEAIGILVGVPSEIVTPSNSRIFFATVGEVVVAAGGIALVSFFASTLTRNTLHALGAAIVFAGALVGLFQWVGYITFNSREAATFDDFILWQGTLIFFVGTLLLTVTMLWRSFVQYNLLQVGRRVLCRTLVAFVCSLLLAATATATVYHRAWEFVLPLEPHHGSAHLTGAISPKLRFSESKVFVLLPDGRLWASTSQKNVPLANAARAERQNDGTSVVKKMSVACPAAGIFVGDSNWTDIAASRYGVVAIQSDGSLWKVFDTTPGVRVAEVPAEFNSPVRIGTDSNWQSVDGSAKFFVALKKDGTIWGWGPQVFIRPNTNLSDEVDGWSRIGTDSDWMKVFAFDRRSIGIKHDGSVWSWGMGTNFGESRIVQSHLSPAGPRRSGFEGTNWSSFQVVGGATDIGLREDGTVWVAGPMLENFFGNNRQFMRKGPYAEPVHVEDLEKQAFTQIRGGWALVGLTSDGGIRESMANGSINPWGKTVRQPSKYSDWIAVEFRGANLFAGLAADGTLTLWHDSLGDWMDDFYEQHSSSGIIVVPSRAPVWSMNILASAKQF